MAESRKSLSHRIARYPFMAVSVVVGLVGACLAVYAAGASGIPLAVFFILAAGWRLAVLLIDVSGDPHDVNHSVDRSAPDKD